jgi:hypothetical protein
MMSKPATPYQIRVDSKNGPRVDCYRTAAAARAEVEAINGTRETRKHGLIARYIGHIDRAGDEWARIVADERRYFLVRAALTAAGIE